MSTEPVHTVCKKLARLVGACPFCTAEHHDSQDAGVLVVILNPESFFLGYYRCSRRCRPGGFPIFFAREMGIDVSEAPGFDPDFEAYVPDLAFPKRHISTDIIKFQGLMHADQRDSFHQMGISDATIDGFRLGYNGRYWVFPYVMAFGDVYAARCVRPDNTADDFWHGNEACTSGEYRIFNIQELERCQGGALIVTLGELNLLFLKELGYPAISVPDAQDLAILGEKLLAGIRTVFVLVDHLPEHYSAARQFASRIGHKVRLMKWPDTVTKGDGLKTQAVEDHRRLPKAVSRLINSARAFSPLVVPEKEMGRLGKFLLQEQGREMLGLPTGFEGLDKALDGLRGINILGGPPKTGKSCWVMQVATELARQHKPVIYYDFENGRQKIYLRTLTRLSSLPEKAIRTGRLSSNEKDRFGAAQDNFRELLTYFRVVTDRQITPGIMVKQIDFLKHETRSDDILVVVDSLHKLPFKNLSERRTGIDFWLRQMEAIRDETNTAFLVISELTRHIEKGYTDKPTMADFKESGDIEYSADNAMILLPDHDLFIKNPEDPHGVALWIVASRENVPGKVADYLLEYPYWRFQEKEG
jgi:KaiC/GvpD/RAD55 family RecA-like ATPase